MGCGFGDDAFYLAKAGARVKAFDLSPDSLSIAKERSAREELKIDFQRMRLIKCARNRARWNELLHHHPSSLPASLIHDVPV